MLIKVFFNGVGDGSSPGKARAPARNAEGSHRARVGVTDRWVTALHRRGRLGEVVLLNRIAQK